MPAYLISTIVSFAAIPIGLAVAAWYGRRRTISVSDDRTIQILQVIAAQGSLDRDDDSWQLPDSHRAPAWPMGVDQAHREMQRHRACGTDSCACKRAAWNTLIDEGHVVAERISA